jgi:putative ABC transport system substrate-binding protein
LALGRSKKLTAVLTRYRPGLAESGYVEGQNLSVHFRCADFHSERLAVLATELTQIPVGAIIAPSGPSVSAARTATQSIPDHFLLLALIRSKMALLPSLNRPGGNVTGVFLLEPALNVKRLEVLHELVPAVKSVAGCLVRLTSLPMKLSTSQFQTAAAALA